MIRNKKILATILAPGFEQGLAKKNFREVSGRSLLEIALSTCKKSKLIDKVVVACDDDETVAFCQARGVDISKTVLFKHPDKAVRFNKSALGIIESIPTYDYIVFLDVSCPLRLAVDIDNSLELSFKNEGKPVVTVADTGFSIGDLHYVDSNRGLVTAVDDSKVEKGNLDRKLYQINYAVLVASRQHLVETGSFFGEDTSAYLIAKERSLTVEKKADLAIAEALVDKLYLPPNNSTLQQQRSLQ